MEIAGNLFAGIVSGVISSALVLVIFTIFKPRVKISDEISAKKLSNGKWLYQVKVVNLTRSMLTNVSYTLRFCKTYRDNMVETQEIEPLKNYLAIINRYDPRQKTANFAVRISYEIDEDTYTLSDGTNLEFTLFASHVLTNASLCKKKEYFAKDICKNSLFEYGKSTKTVINH